MECLVAEHDIGARVGQWQIRTVAVQQLDVTASAFDRAAGGGGIGREPQRWFMEVDANDAGRLECIGKQPEGFALPAANVDDHRRRVPLAGHESLEIVDRYAKDVMLPGTSAQEPDAERSLRHERNTMSFGRRHVFAPSAG